MNYFFEEYPLSDETRSLANNRKAYAISCFSDLARFLGMKNSLEFEKVQHLFNLAYYRRNTFLISDTIISDRFFYIIEGSTRAFIKKDGEELTQLILTEGNVNTNIATLTNTREHDAFLVTLEDAEILEISYSNFEQLQILYPEVILIFSKGMAIYLRFQQLFSDVMKAEAKEKFNFLQTRMPQLLNRCPLKYQAAFMGMKPETLSRIRNEVRYS